MPDSLPAGMQMGDVVGEARIMLEGRMLASVPLVLTESLTPRDYAFELERVLRCWPLQGRAAVGITQAPPEATGRRSALHRCVGTGKIANFRGERLTGQPNYDTILSRQRVP